MDTMNTLLFRRRLSEKASQLLMLFIFIALITCPLLVPQPMIFIIIGVVDLVISIVVWYLIYNKILIAYSAQIIIVASYICVMPLILISGGVNSHFIYLVPVSPMMTGLLMNARAARVVSGLLIVNMLLLVLFRNYIPDMTFEQSSNSQTVLRGYWVILATIITTVYVHYFEQFNELLSARLKDQAYNDPLTRIANRRSILEALNAAVAASKNKDDWLSLVMIDIDHFKKLNDTYGHLAGDDCLVAVAKSLSRCIRRNSDMVGRIGGEEFLAILPGVSAIQVSRVAEQMRGNIENLLIDSLHCEKLSVTATLGCFSGKGKELTGADQLLQLADEALYEGKNAGRNQVVLKLQRP